MLTTTVRGSSTRAFLLRSRPNRPKTVLMPMASSTPRPMPTTEPTRPTTPASSSTDRATWRRLAPIARSRASSRLRWATRIENVLTMRNAPTVSAMPAKTRRKVVTNDSASSIRLAARAAVASPVAAWVSDGSTFATLARSSSWLVPGAAVTQICENASSPWRNSCCAWAVSNMTTLAPTSVDPPNAAVPTRRTSRRGCSVAVTMGTVSPSR